MEIAPDIVAAHGHLFLGSRLKRLAERMQADVAQVFHAAGHAVQPAHMPLLAALDAHGPLTVGAAGDALGVSQPAVTQSLRGMSTLGLVTTRPSPTDRRRTEIALTPAGETLLAQAKASYWPHIDAAVAAICAPLKGPLLTQIAALEAALAAAPLAQRVAARTADRPAPADALELVEFTDELAPHFARINREWIEAMYVMEPHDHDVLDHPRQHIVDPGGTILFARAADLGIVGACALMKIEDGVYELTKMGVTASARGRKVGEYLLGQVIARARNLPVQTLFLLTNRASQAAIHLYEKLGFVHDAAIMARYGRLYARCNVGMSYPL